MDLSALEWIILFFNLLYVILAGKRSIWCWPAGIIASGIQGYVMFNAHLNSEGVLMIFYVVAGIYGWISWNLSKKNNRIPVRNFAFPHHATIILIGIGGTWGLFELMERFFTSDQPLFDAATTSFAFLATWLTAKRILSSWLYWIVINIATAIMYLRADLEILSYQMIGLSVLAVYGYILWKKEASVSF